MHFLLISSLFWFSSVGPFSTELECKDAASRLAWYVTAGCIHSPAPQQPAPAEHKH